MEKYSQFRDRGSGISPFLPIKTPLPIYHLPVRLPLALFRATVFAFAIPAYFLVLDFLPLPPALRKLLLWGLMGIPGIWWVDIQIDGVKRGHLSEQPPDRVPHPGSIIAANFTSPIDAIYLAGVFDPIFTISYPGSRKVRRVSLLGAMTQALSKAQLDWNPPARSKLTDLRTLLAQNPGRIIVCFPECGTSNGRGTLPFSPSLLTVPASSKIFPVSLRYTPSDITTPVPGAWVTFFWNLLSRFTHTVRVRIAEGIDNTSAAETNGAHDSYAAAAAGGSGEDGNLAKNEQAVLDKVAEALARLSRNKRVGLTLRDKAAFVDTWKKG